MYFENLSGLKATCRSVQQLKIVKIAVILLLSVQIIEASIALGIDQFNFEPTPLTKTAETDHVYGFGQFNVQSKSTTKAPETSTIFKLGQFHIKSTPTPTSKAAEAGNIFRFGQFNVHSTPTPKPVESENLFRFGQFNVHSTPTPKPAEAGNIFRFGQFNVHSTPTPKPVESENIFRFGQFNVRSAPTPKPVEAGNIFRFGQFNVQSTSTTKTPDAGHINAFDQFNSASTSTTKAATTTTTIPTKAATTKAAFTTLMTKSAGTGDYCSMCKSHVACKKNNTFGEACSDDAELVKMDNDQKETTLKLHNKMRNKIAMGEMKEYGPAAKMPVFQWDDELMKLAEINARSCVFKHDTCRATKKFPYAGQNIARRYNNIEYEDKDIAIEEMITKWFSENKDADMSYIKSYHNQKKGKQIGHFTIMINDKNNAVGCASSKYFSKGNYYRYLVCNYGFTNVLTRPVYEDGATGSKCTKRHPVYKGLCSVEQVVIPVP